MQPPSLDDAIKAMDEADKGLEAAKLARRPTLGPRGPSGQSLPQLYTDFDEAVFALIDAMKARGKTSVPSAGRTYSWGTGPGGATTFTIADDGGSTDTITVSQ